MNRSRLRGFIFQSATAAVLVAALPLTVPAQSQGDEPTLLAPNQAAIADSVSDQIPADSPLESISIFATALELIRAEYVDGDKVDYKKLIYGALSGILASLDPHSQFMEPESFKDMRDDTREQFGGLGIKVETRTGILTVLAPMEDTPGSRAGLVSGDQIIEIDGKTTEKLSLTDSIRLLRGEPGTKVLLRVHRPSTGDFLKLEITREIIRVQSVQDAHILPSQDSEPKIAYVRIVQFNEPTADDFRSKLKQLETDGMQALVLDLRNNPGGLIDSAVDVCAEFLPPNELVVYTEGRDPAQRRNYRTPKSYTARKWFPVAVLINGGSASGSEIVAGALKDLDRAIIVGETSFGKGSVQTVSSLPDGSAMRLTTAKYYTPGKQVIHERGISPTILVTMSREEEAAMMARRNSDELPREEQERLEEIPDRQLDRAIDVLRAVLIFKDRGATSAKTPATKKSSPASR